MSSGRGTCSRTLDHAIAVVRQHSLILPPRNTTCRLKIAIIIILCGFKVVSPPHEQSRHSAGRPPPLFPGLPFSALSSTCHAFLEPAGGRGTRVEYKVNDNKLQRASLAIKIQQERLETEAAEVCYPIVFVLP